jgi:hypothetical protein
VTNTKEPDRLSAARGDLLGVMKEAKTDPGLRACVRAADKVVRPNRRVELGGVFLVSEVPRSYFKTLRKTIMKQAI